MLVTDSHGVLWAPWVHCLSCGASRCLDWTAAPATRPRHVLWLRCRRSAHMLQASHLRCAALPVFGNLGFSKGIAVDIMLRLWMQSCSAQIQHMLLQEYALDHKTIVPLANSLPSLEELHVCMVPLAPIVEQYSPGLRHQLIGRTQYTHGMTVPAMCMYDTNLPATAQCLCTDTCKCCVSWSQLPWMLTASKACPRWPCTMGSHLGSPLQ
jgi:hypothetical protein